MVKSERVKVVVVFDGRSEGRDAAEAVDKETNERKAWVLNFPYVVTYDTPKLDGTSIVEDQRSKVHYSPWNPLALTYRLQLI